MATVHHEITIGAPVAKVYEALSSVDRIRTWWDEQTAVRTDRGLVLDVEWECISSPPKSSAAFAWTGTRFVEAAV